MKSIYSTPDRRLTAVQSSMFNVTEPDNRSKRSIAFLRLCCAPLRTGAQFKAFKSISETRHSDLRFIRTKRSIALHSLDGLPLTNACCLPPGAYGSPCMRANEDRLLSASAGGCNAPEIDSSCESGGVFELLGFSRSPIAHGKLEGNHSRTRL